MSRPIILVVSLLVFILIPACGSTLEETGPVVAANSPLSPETEPLLVDADSPEEQRFDDPNRIIARVDDEIITYRSLQALYPVAMESIPDMGEESARAFVDHHSLRLISDRLLLGAAEKSKIMVSRADLDRESKRIDEVARKRGTTLEEDLEAQGIALWEWEEEVARRIKIERYLAYALGLVRIPERHREYAPRATEDVHVRPQEVRAFYDRNLAVYTTRESARLDALFFRASGFEDPGAAARDAVRRARGGESFATLKEQLDARPPESILKPLIRGSRKGDEVEGFAWSAAPGEISEPLSMGVGYLVLRLVERTEDGVLPFEEMRKRIHPYLVNLKREGAAIRIQLRILKDAVVEPGRLKRALKQSLTGELEMLRQALLRYPEQT